MLTKREQYVLRKFHSMRRAFPQSLIEGTEFREMDRHAVGKWRRHVEEWGFQHEGSGCYSVVVSHPTVPDKVIKHNPGNSDDTFGLMVHLLVIRHERLPEVYHVEGDFEKYTAVVERLDANAGWDKDTCRNDDPQGWQQCLDLLHNMGYIINDLHEDNIMMRGDDINAWVINDPSNGSSRDYS